MPKVIENLRENILINAKAQLLAKGYFALTMRGVAKKCGIAVGTVYNYFPSKEVLVASIMLEDWKRALSLISEECARAQGVTDALDALNRGINGFYDIYRSVWEGYSFTGSAKAEYTKRRGMLAHQLAECIKPALEKCGYTQTEELSIFLVENVLTCAGNSALTYESFKNIVKRILP